MSVIVNFSYGSNMLARRIAQRVPSARPVQRAVLQGYELRWHKVGQDGSGKCDIVRSERPGSVVHGVLYQFARDEKHLLDAAEGLGRGYDERQVSVEGDSGIVHAWAYVATATDPQRLPFNWYRALVVAGAMEHGLPAPYVQSLRATPAVDDADVGRARLHFALAGRHA
ncbi:MAG: gamma-glutamylcyclotransferase [Rubrivivax sp.]|nr:gamma-glutamylcyclotransferase [Rubrivivax sp.]